MQLTQINIFSKDPIKILLTLGNTLEIKEKPPKKNNTPTIEDLTKKTNE